ncbi:MAG: transposase [Mariprofundus sp.]
MARPLRLEYPGAVYHITSRGNAQADIFLTDSDRLLFMQMLKEEIEQQQWHCYAYCLMDNHYHVLIETPEGNLVRGMQRLNGRYTQHFNHRHQRVGHVFQGRYRSILVQKGPYFQELLRYIVLNPVRAGMAEHAAGWPWSSYQATVDESKQLCWMAGKQVLALFADQRSEAVRRYMQFVDDGIGRDSPWESLQGQIFLGDELFLKHAESLLKGMPPVHDIPGAQNHPTRPTVQQVLSDVADAFAINVESVLDRKSQKRAYQAAVYLLRRRCNLPLKAVAELAGVSSSRISQIQANLVMDKLPDALKKTIK